MLFLSPRVLPFLVLLFIEFQALAKAFVHFSSAGRLRSQEAAARRYASTAASDSAVTFDWRTKWYPIAPVQDLNVNGPNKLTLLGMDLAVWFHEPSKRWRVFRDKCPHRLVPLSEGRTTVCGELQCAYHGWEFNDEGKCVRIPQLPGTSSPAVSSPRACAMSFPCRVEQGLLWAFPTANETLAAYQEPSLIPQLDDPDLVDATNFFCRDMPYSWEILVENLCDPAHIPFAHHSVMNGADRNNVEEIDLKIVEEGLDGFKAQKDPYPTGKGKYDVKFEPPCLLYYTLVDEQAKSYIGLGQYCVPTAPGRCRLMARFPFRLSVKPAMFFIRRTPRWITHFSQNVVMDSDVVFLASQEEYLKQSGTQQYYMPSRCDAMVSAFRTWLSRVGGGPEYLGIPAQRSDGEPTGWLRPRQVLMRGGRDALLDRYRQHTDSCSSCRRAHKTLYALREASVAVGICLLATAAAGGLPRKVAATTGAGLLLAPKFVLQPLISRLECVPWPRKSWRKDTSQE